MFINQTAVFVDPCVRGLINNMHVCDSIYPRIIIPMISQTLKKADTSVIELCVIWNLICNWIITLMWVLSLKQVSVTLASVIFQIWGPTSPWTQTSTRLQKLEPTVTWQSAWWLPANPAPAVGQYTGEHLSCDAIIVKISTLFHLFILDKSFFEKLFRN